MKKLIFIIVGIVLFSGYAFSQGNNKDVAHANFELNVAIPIGIIDPGTILLGDVAPGTTKTFADPSLYRMAFQISGGASMAFTLSGTVAATGSSADCLLNYSWQENIGAGWVPNATAFPWAKALDINGLYQIGIVPNTVQANSNAAAGLRSFEVIITATYSAM